MLDWLEQLIKRNNRLKAIALKILKSHLGRNLAQAILKQDSNFIDVRELIQNSTVDEHVKKAEQYFSRLTNYDYQLAKPFASIVEAPELLMAFASILSGLRLLPEMTVLDFGCGTCWTSKYLTQLGCKVIALDVSPSALKIGKELYSRQPIIGDKPHPKFLQFDGYKFDLTDESVDRILCFDAFHHIPNPENVLKWIQDCFG
jgi:2-polyprenyl-3-methyl-5-hydroxy-6-metoxy-1,4-benzoquinol methylase